jgi:hypothetical protein
MPKDILHVIKPSDFAFALGMSQSGISDILNSVSSILFVIILELIFYGCHFTIF